jgi:hypothetical protein
MIMIYYGLILFYNLPVMNNNNLKHSGITEKIIGCAMKVHSIMKTGHTELIIPVVWP